MLIYDFQSFYLSTLINTRIHVFIITSFFFFFFSLSLSAIAHLSYQPNCTTLSCITLKYCVPRNGKIYRMCVLIVEFEKKTNNNNKIRKVLKACALLPIHSFDHLSDIAQFISYTDDSDFESCLK